VNQLFNDLLNQTPMRSGDGVEPVRSFVSSGRDESDYYNTNGNRDSASVDISGNLNNGGRDSDRQQEATGGPLHLM
jgi:hypothetical protein